MSMKRFVYGATCLLALLVTACGNTDRKSSDLPQIDMDVEYPEKEICLQDIAEVSYIPLESKDDFLFQGKLEEFSSGGIAVIGDDKIYLFHPDGKARNVINKKGQGPGEYQNVYYAEFDWDKEEVYVHLIPQHQILVYSLDGTFKRQLKLDENLALRQHDMTDEAEHLLMFKIPKGGKEGKLAYPYRPIVRISKADGTMDSLSYQQNYYTSTCIKVLTGDGNPLLTLIDAPAFRSLNGSKYVNEVSLDTIYRIDGDALIPVMTRTPSVQEEKEKKCFLQMFGITPRYYFLRRTMQELAFNRTLRAFDYVAMDGKDGWLLYDKETGEAFSAKLTNKDYQEELSYNYLEFDGCDANTAYMKLDAFELTEALEAGQLSGELKTIAQGLKEDDNPVLMVVKFK
ncbi:MAG: 6-bladed beta-propeller [Mediterranea massiliensis]|nr:6-bladed beta-propeller [Mediterranea massiliensis]